MQTIHPQLLHPEDAGKLTDLKLNGLQAFNMGIHLKPTSKLQLDPFAICQKRIN